MNPTTDPCAEFAKRLQQQIDRRADLEADAVLRRHADDCSHCRAEWETWQRIEAAIASSESSDRERTRPAASPVTLSRPRLVAVGLAASLLFVAFLQWRSASESGDLQASVGPVPAGPAVSTPVSPIEVGSAGLTGQPDPSGWWREVQGRDWVAQTMPAVKSVRDGVAPLGRSLLQAVTILTLGGQGRPT